MDTILQAAKDYATLINSVLLIVLLFKYASDIRKQRLEYEKLERELKALCERDAEATKRVLVATADEITRFVIEPAVEAIRRREYELLDRHHSLLRSFSDASDRMAALAEGGRFGRELVTLLEHNILTIQHLDKHLKEMELRELERNKAQQDAAPNGGSAPPSAKSGGTEGPPSLS